MTDDTPEPDLQRIVEETVPTTPRRREVERAIVDYAIAWEDVKMADERGAGMKETRRVLDRAKVAYEVLWALLDRISWDEP